MTKYTILTTYSDASNACELFKSVHPAGETLADVVCTIFKLWRENKICLNNEFCADLVYDACTSEKQREIDREIESICSDPERTDEFLNCIQKVHYDPIFILENGNSALLGSFCMRMACS